MSDFVGRRSYIATLETELGRVRPKGRGCLVSMRGRRRVGKSRLVDEFLRRGAHPPVPYVFFTASRQPFARELELFAQDVARSELPAADVVRGGGVTFESWDGGADLPGHHLRWNAADHRDGRVPLPREAGPFPGGDAAESLGRIP